VLRSVLDALEQALIAMLAEHHRRQPLSDGVPREEARERLFGRGHTHVFERALDELSASGTVAVRDRLALASHRVVLSSEERRAYELVDHAFRERGLRPPDLSWLATEAHLAPTVVDRVVRLLQRDRLLVKIDALMFHIDALNQLKQDVQSLRLASGQAVRIDVAWFKERFDVTRKFAIPLLEYLDRERVTRRVGDSRMVL
jgi:selenocysteine-specific elongation factor